MKILCVCDHGNNRSVHLAHQLKYRGHDVLTAGLLKNESATLDMLFSWADVIIITDTDQLIPEKYAPKVQLWYIGPDVYRRPMNKELLEIVQDLIDDNPLTYAKEEIRS